MALLSDQSKSKSFPIVKMETFCSWGNKILSQWVGLLMQSHTTMPYTVVVKEFGDLALGEK